MTSTYAKLKISYEAYTEIREKLVEAGYLHLFVNIGSQSEVMVMGEIGLVPTKGCSMSSHHWNCICNGMGGDR
jgi:hypothetical protein